MNTWNDNSIGANLRWLILIRLITSRVKYVVSKLFPVTFTIRSIMTSNTSIFPMFRSSSADLFCKHALACACWTHHWCKILIFKKAIPKCIIYFLLSNEKEEMIEGLKPPFFLRTTNINGQSHFPPSFHEYLDPPMYCT